MSWTDPARVEKLEGLLYKCLSTFSLMLWHPVDLIDQRHVQYAHDELESRMRELDLPDYQTWSGSAGKGHEGWTCNDLGGTGANGEQVFNCSKCGCVLSLYDRDGSNNLCTSFVHDYPRFCPECGRRVVPCDSE